MADASEQYRPGEPPPVRDEAADSPLWLPVLGLCFLVFGAFALIWQSSNADDAPDAGDAVAIEADEAAPTDDE